MLESAPRTVDDLCRDALQAARGGDFAAAETAADQARQLAAIRGERSLAYLQALYTHICVRYAQGRFADAQDDIARYAQLHLQVRNADETGLYTLHTSLAHEAAAHGDRALAAEHYAHAAEAAQAFYRPDDPRRERRLMPWWAIINRALALSELGQHRDAETYAWQAVKGAEATDDNTAALKDLYEKLRLIKQRAGTLPKDAGRPAPEPASADERAAAPHQQTVEGEQGPIVYDDEDREETLEEILAELDAIVGMEGVKAQIHSLAKFLRTQARRQQRGFKKVSRTYHMAFIGPPGTGKTMMGRFIARIFKALGILKTAKLVEVSTPRAQLIAGVIGKTADKVNQVVDSALDGVLFIDEVYLLVNGGENDFGPEAVGTLMARMYNDRHRLVVIIAGYPEETLNFIEANPGLPSRVPTIITFESYTDKELEEIFVRFFAGKNDYTLTAGAKRKLRSVLKQAREQVDPKYFGNARTAENIFEDSIEAHGNRIADLEEREGREATDAELTTLHARDIVLDPHPRELHRPPVTT